MEGDTKAQQKAIGKQKVQPIYGVRERFKFFSILQMYKFKPEKSKNGEIFV